MWTIHTKLLEFGGLLVFAGREGGRVAHRLPHVLQLHHQLEPVLRFEEERGLLRDSEHVEDLVTHLEHLCRLQRRREQLIHPIDQYLVRDVLAEEI